MTSEQAALGILLPPSLVAGSCGHASTPGRPFSYQDVAARLARHCAELLALGLRARWKLAAAGRWVPWRRGHRK
jgi:hypothetical protein